MENELHYDVHAMKTAGAECLQMLREICCKADLMETAFLSEGKGAGQDTGPRSEAERKNFAEAMQGFHAACDGYEKLLQYMEAAANIYGMTGKTIQENMDF
ncbi:MAG: hypothetical protein IKD92_06560 [Lachnospiraceae bacterium]|nr:hypothetical protein [Lachnospiraceae bacterium]